MNLLKLSVVAASAAIVIGARTAARATIIVPVTLNVANGYYLFESTSDPGLSAANEAAFNGSWVEFQNDSLVNWDITDNQLLVNNAWIGNLPDYPADYPPFTPANSTIDPGEYGASFNYTAAGDEFEFYIGNASAEVQDFVEVSNNIVENSDNSWGQITSGEGDPLGTWTFDLTQPGLDPVPDSSSTFELLAGILIAVATVASRKRNRAAIGA